MNRVLLFLMVGLFTFSCSDTKDAIQENPAVVSKEEMVRILIELYVTEQKVDKLKLKTDSSQKIFSQLENKIFQKVGVKSDSFKASLNYYVDRPKELEWIYTALVDSLSLREQRLSVPK